METRELIRDREPEAGIDDSAEMPETADDDLAEGTDEPRNL